MPYWQTLKFDEKIQGMNFEILTRLSIAIPGIPVNLCVRCERGGEGSACSSARAVCNLGFEEIRMVSFSLTNQRAYGCSARVHGAAAVEW